MFSGIYKRYLWTRIIDVTLDAAFSRVAAFAARTLILGRAARRAEAYLVAFTRSVARDHGFHATD